MQRYFGNIANQNVILNEDDIHHITHVMRMRVGDEFEFVNDEKLYLCQIKSVQPFTAFIQEQIDADVEIKNRVTLFFALAKGDKIDFVIQKATELGVHRIVLFKCKRCVVDFSNEDFKKKVIRYQKIAKEASEQCHRLIIPEILGVVDIDNIPNELKSDINFIAYEKNAGKIGNVLESIKDKSVSVMIGPEGGFEEKEVNSLLNQGFTSISLGKRILRCETAAVYALSVIAYLMEK